MSDIDVTRALSPELQTVRDLMPMRAYEPRACTFCGETFTPTFVTTTRHPECVLKAKALYDAQRRKDGKHR